MDPVTKAIQMANLKRLQAYNTADPIFHAEADLLVHAISTAAWLETVKARLRERGVVVDGPAVTKAISLGWKVLP